MSYLFGKSSEVFGAIPLEPDPDCSPGKPKPK